MGEGSLLGTHHFLGALDRYAAYRRMDAVFFCPEVTKRSVKVSFVAELITNSLTVGFKPDLR